MHTERRPLAISEVPTPIGAPGQLAQPCFQGFSEGPKGRCGFHFGGRIFQRVGAIAEQLLLLCPTSQNSWIKRFIACPFCQHG